MQMCTSLEQFNTYYQLFKSEYFQYQEFINYFEMNWVSSQSKITSWRYFDSKPGVFF